MYRKTPRGYPWTQVVGCSVGCILCGINHLTAFHFATQFFGTAVCLTSVVLAYWRGYNEQ